MHVRKHGPIGYKEWESYRPWLRDEFDFRCVFCLRREIWDQRRAVFAIEHLVPRKLAPERALDYTNLVYACGSCNSAKSAQSAPDPCDHTYDKLVEVQDDGTIQALNAEGRRLIRTVCLDDAKTTAWRRSLIENFRCYAKYEPALYRERLGFPDDLPDLSKCVPPGGNTKLNSESTSRYQQRFNGALPIFIEIECN